MKIQVTNIEIEFSKGSFSDWANAMEDQSENDVVRWEAAYNKQISDELQKIYPNAEITVGEGYDQLMNTKYHVTTKEVESDGDYDTDDDIGHYLVVDDVKLQIDAIIETVANDGSFWQVA